jgi:hypothetical protein
MYNGIYDACVKAVYGSGYSTGSCDNFQSKFLFPPTNLQVTAVECAAYLTWEKPVVGKKLSIPAFTGTIEKSNEPQSAGLAPIDRSKIAPAQNIASSERGSIAFGFEAVAGNWVDFDVDNLAGLTILGASPVPSATFINGMVYPVGETNLAYVTLYGNSHLFTVNHTTQAWTDLGSYGSATFNDIAIDPTTNIIYGTTGSDLYTIDPAGPSSTLIGSHGGGITLMISMAADGNGDLWAYDMTNDVFYSVDKTTGAATSVGPIGFNAGYAQCMFYDQATDQVIMGAMNFGNLTAEIRAVDVTTGASTILSSYYYNEISAAALPIGGGPAVEGLVGYKIYRDGAYRAIVHDPDTLFWYDFTVDPGAHAYEVSAYYDLTDYGYPGQFDESMLEGPKNVNIECGRPLPFYEPWDQGSFDYNTWSHNGNWSLNSGVGSPAPSADFSWQPTATNYSQWIETSVLNAGPYTCAKIYLDFDYKLLDRNHTGKEYLTVETYVGGGYKKVAEYSNNGDVNWTSKHLELKGTKGKSFKVRFRANGASTLDILHWYVDNVKIYAVCTPPNTLAVVNIADNDVHLSWTGPDCTTFSGAKWITWDDGTNTNSIGTGAAAEFDIAQRWTPDQIATLKGGAVMKIRFWPALSGGSATTYKIRVWEGADAATLLVDQAVPSPTLDDWNEVTIDNPVPIDITKELWIGVSIVAATGYPAGVDAGPAIDGYGNMMLWQGSWTTLLALSATLNYNWDIEGYVDEAKSGKSTILRGITQTPSYSTGTFSANPAPVTRKAGTPRTMDQPIASSLQGYNIYRSDDNKVSYQKINSAIVTDTTYTDMNVGYSVHYYYVTSVFTECNSDSSNVVMADVMTGMDQLSKGGISIYPNPASEVVNIKSNSAITGVEVMNFVGQTVYSNSNVDATTAKLNVSTFMQGVYFVKVTTSEGSRTVKITVTH